MQESGESQYGVYINGVTLEYAQTYIDAINTGGVTFFNAGEAEERQAAVELWYFNCRDETQGAIYLLQSAKVNGLIPTTPSTLSKRCKA